MRFIPTTTSPQKGFTLLELIVALSIFALVSVMAYRGLEVAQTAKQHTEQRMQAFKALQMTLLLMQKDFEQMVSRPIRDEFGDTVPALTNNSEHLIEFTKTGERSLNHPMQSRLKRTAYRLQDDTLLRLQWLTLDRANLEQPPKERQLLSDVEAAIFRYLHTDEQWHEQWPPSPSWDSNPLNNNNSGGNGIPLNSDPMPLAVEVTLTTKRWGDIRRVFLTAHAFAP